MQASPAVILGRPVVEDMITTRTPPKGTQISRSHCLRASNLPVPGVWSDVYEVVRIENEGKLPSPL